MRSFLAALRSLVLPYNATSGNRIVLDGVNGVIQVYNATGLVGQIDSNGVLVEQQGQFALQGPNGNGVFLLNNSGQPSILMVGKSGTTAGTIAFDTTSTPGGFVQWVQGGKGALCADAAKWFFRGETTGTGVAFEPISATMQALAGGNVETWHPIALQNGWVARGASWATPSYRLMPDGTVLLKGQMKSGTTADGTKIGTLPVGYRPIDDDNYPITSYVGSNDAILEVNPDGSMYIFNVGAGPLTVGLGGVRIPLI